MPAAKEASMNDDERRRQGDWRSFVSDVYRYLYVAPNNKGTVRQWSELMMIT